MEENYVIISFICSRTTIYVLINIIDMLIFCCYLALASRLEQIQINIFLQQKNNKKKKICHKICNINNFYRL